MMQCTVTRRHGAATGWAPARQRGLTLVELLVAMAISTLLALAAITAMTVSRQGFSTVDTASQLRDNARFATDLIQRLGVQSGFKDVNFVTVGRPVNQVGVVDNPLPNISGYNNSSFSASVLSAGSDPLASTLASGVNGSDILVLRYQTVETFPGSGVADKSMIDCSGFGSAVAPADRDDRLLSILHVAMSDGEPTLMCTTLVPSSTSTYTTTALVKGVETLQILYGVDGVTPNTASVALAASSPASGNTFGLLPKVFLRADQMVVNSDPVGKETNNNWRRVRSVRVGMILRGPIGSAQQGFSGTSGATQTPVYNPLGPAPSASNAAAGTALSAAVATDPGTRLTPTDAGGNATTERRLRQTVTFTVHLRNEQGS